MPCFVKERATRQLHAGELRDVSHCEGKFAFLLMKLRRNDAINVKQIHMGGEEQLDERRFPAAIFHWIVKLPTRDGR